MSSIQSSNPQFAVLFSAYECVLNGENAIYCSSELTSGRRAFEEMQRQNVQTTEELKKKLDSKWFPKIMGPNIELAIRFADTVRQAEGGKTLVITPAPLKVKGWGKDWGQT